MLRITICDDVDNELRHIAGLTKKFPTKRSLSAEIREFRHPGELLTACGINTFHIFLLDMVMPMVSGLELGRSIRRSFTAVRNTYMSYRLGEA